MAWTPGGFPVLESRRLVLVAMATVTLLLSLAIALNVSPHLRGPDERRWHFALPSKPIRHFIPVWVVGAYVAITASWRGRIVQGKTSGWERRVFLLFIVLSVPIIQASLYTVEAPDILEQPFYRTGSSTSNGVFQVGSTINDPIDYLRRYPEKMPTFPIHPRRYPPGLPLLFYGTRRLLKDMPAVSHTLASRLRLYQCHSLALMRLPDETIASSIVQVILPVICGLVVLPIYGLARRARGERVALLAATLYPLVPSFNLWFARWDAFYALLAATIWLLFYIGLVESRYLHLMAAGGLLSLASFFSFGNLALLLPMGCWAGLWLVTYRDMWSWRRLVTGISVFGVSSVSLWGLYQAALGTGFFDIWRMSMSYHLGLGRSYWLWLGYHIYDFFLFLGISLAFLFLLSLVGEVRGSAWKQKALLPIGFGLGLLLLDLSGMSQGEVARVWLFLTPFATLGAAHGLDRLHMRPAHAFLVFSLLAVQLLIFNAFLRVVNTGLYDPPNRQRITSPPTVPFPQKALLGDRIAFLGYDVGSTRVKRGETMHLTLYWQPTESISQPYTVFTHLVGSDGQLMAQQDNMPVKGKVPTTCWMPGEVIVDPYDITVDTDISPVRHRLETGLYLWTTGERLTTEGEGATSDGRVVLTEISVGVE